MHLTAYQNLRKYLGLPVGQPKTLYMAEKLAVIEADVAERLEADKVWSLRNPPQVLCLLQSTTSRLTCRRRM